MSDGKSYEIFVQKLQQALINAEDFMSQKNIEIERNKKITDNCGIDREFDLYWEYELAGLTYKTVIECKDYASAISVEKIDALIGKVKDLPDLIPVFATKTGYQSGAKIKAQHNKIELLIVREQTDDDWTDKEGNPLIKKINLNFKFLSPARITSFNPLVDNDWLKENPEFDVEKYSKLLAPNNEIFIEDIYNQDTYSLFELAKRLEEMSKGYGEQRYEEILENAYLVSNNLKVKICKYEVKYVVPNPIEHESELDFSKELWGIIEYLHQDSFTAIFKDKIVKDWR